MTPQTAARPAFLSFTISQSLLKLTSIELVMLSNHVILCLPLLFPPPIFPSIRVFSSELAFHITWPKCWSFSFSISPSTEYPELTSLRLTGLISLQSKGLSRVFSSSTVQKHHFFGTHPLYEVQLSHLYMTTGQTTTLTTQNFVDKVMSLSNILPKFVIAFLPRSKHPLISWLHSPSTVILVPKKIRSATVSTFPMSISPSKAKWVYQQDGSYSLPESPL